MELNYSILAIVLLVVIILFILFIRRNRRDKKNMEKDLSTGEVKPEQHDRGSI
ncbi:hypothetical protein [Pedobacter sp. MR2016-24]|uniref:hypothetical protein n=1 Tax=Pedobacter sp. MR2016-24 TaxID=2994466 RepID=UPI0022454805|nr:hypothetical protein [Pedobacter sp. MR2016-24]MCX2486427.1 hypothetical protein [Pedobacter sp. MR2016-24]